MKSENNSDKVQLLSTDLDEIDELMSSDDYILNKIKAEDRD